jgi:UDP-2,3-diacylglucosamine hydrolase
LRTNGPKPDGQRRFRASPHAARRDPARAARAGSKAHTQRTIPTIMDVNPEAVTRAMRATGAKRLIHGHTHRPAVHPFVVDGVSAERVVHAPWYEAASCVGVSAGGVSEVPLPR